MRYGPVQQESGTEVGSQEPVSLRVPSSPEYVLLPRLVVSSVGETAGFDSRDVYDLKLAVTEAVTNVIRHARVESMLVEYRALAGVVEVTVADTGGGFDATGTGGDIGESGDESGGFGIAVIRSLVDEMVLDSSEKGTTVRITRYAAGPGGS
ncbi:ATP-binding protein [Rubrobacter aplysinae]|uniref:ATP-binding protein n=1 Tax=Rubrobacter aplysinae TaxID=909625 RepID=UPI00064C1DC2|nr:ATP-binding protein [Rubrobacter aplysinae]